MNKLNSSPISFYLMRANQAIDSNDYIMAAHFFCIAEEMGSLEAKIGLAALSISGHYQPTDVTTGQYAEMQLRQVIETKTATDKVRALALNNLATLYATGAEGIDADMKKSAEEASRARDLGFPF
ncbi:MAG: hypothetical protein ACK5SG_04415 [Burkholderiales bacterium]|jgi:hypothetical protein